MGQNKLVGPATTYIAGELRAQAARRDWTLDDIARETGVARSTASRYLKGASAISVEALIPLALGMGLNPVELLTEAMKRV